MAAARGEDVIALKKLNIDPVSDDDEDEFEPLFSYGQTVGPAPTFSSDDSDNEEITIAAAPRRKPATKPAKEPPTQPPQKAPVKKSVTLDDDDDDDDSYSWLTSIPSPPKLPKEPQPVSSVGSLALQLLRQQRQELMMLQEASSLAAISRVEEQARMQVLQQRVESEKETESPSPSPLVVEAPEVVLKSQTKPPKSEAHASEEKEKVLLKVQNKAGNCQSIRVFTTDKFEKLFTVYAKMVEASLPNLSFRFDGDPLSPTSTPKEHDMEDGDIIEVYTKS